MGEAGSAAHATKETFGTAIRVLGKYLLPVAGIAAGWVSGPFFGGIPSIANAIYGATGHGSNTTGLSATSATRIAGVLWALIMGLAGGAFWAMRGKGGVYMEAIGGLMGGFFFGLALFGVQIAITGAGPVAGWFDTLAADISNVGQGR